MGTELRLTPSRDPSRQRRVFIYRRWKADPPTGGLISIDPARGELIQLAVAKWTYESVNAASPVVAGNKVFISASYRAGGALLIRAGRHASCTLDDAGIRPHFNTAIHKDGYLLRV